MTPKEVVNRFYTAFSQKDTAMMSELYSDEAVFEDDVFGQLSANEARAMWTMLLKRSKDISISWSPPELLGTVVSTQWTARYTFGPAKRQVVNVIRASFVVDNGKIVQHRDAFSFADWARQALGPMGKLFGWTSFLKNKVHQKVRSQLQHYMEQNGLKP
ncbi:MAG: nuclear transport factor 2 family protein [Saprospiraceae bacterium]|nr:nuclear transport factor 2 family protein [Saprospiraceae bacterium]